MMKQCYETKRIVTQRYNRTQVHVYSYLQIQLESGTRIHLLRYNKTGERIELIKDTMGTGTCIHLLTDTI